MATSAAALHFSCGASKKQDVMRKAELEVGRNTQNEGKRRDSSRIREAEQRVREQHKKYKLVRRQAKQRDEELRISREGVTYEAGGFDGMEACSEPRKKKKRKDTKKT